MMGPARVRGSPGTRVRRASHRRRAPRGDVVLQHAERPQKRSGAARAAAPGAAAGAIHSVNSSQFSGSVNGPIGIVVNGPIEDRARSAVSTGPFRATAAGPPFAFPARRGRSSTRNNSALIGPVRPVRPIG
eukprot:gene2012-biopygen9065